MPVRHDDVQLARDFQRGHARAPCPVNMEAGLAAAAPATKEAAYCAGMTRGVGFGEAFKCVPTDINNTSALYVAGDKT